MKQSKVIKKVLSVIMATAMLAAMTSCKLLEGIDFSFEGKCKTTEDGFVYFVGYKEGEKDKVYIISLPDSEEVTIPEYIDGKKVVQIGYLEQGIGYRKEHYVDFSKVKKLTIQHSFDYKYVLGIKEIERMIYIDFIYCKFGEPFERKILMPANVIKYGYRSNAVVELRLKDKRKDTENFSFGSIEIPEYVKIIDAGVFDGIEGVTIKTENESKPDGWEDGWNGNCEVVWGAELIGRAEQKSLER